jgi:hypothetical protein
MPPAAISRSSTYFPKICGNIAAYHRSAFLAALLAFGCRAEEAPVTTVVVGAHELSGCRLPPSGQSVTLTLTALGPFALTSACGPERCDVVSVPLRSGGQPLGFPAETAGVDAVAKLGEALFAGYAERPKAGSLDVLLWPSAESCRVYTTTDGYPGTAGGQALGYSPEHGLVLVVGEDTDDARAQGALTVSTRTGEVALQPASASPPSPVAFATLTPFDGGLLLAGGENPTRNPDPAQRERFDRAYVFDAETRSFASEPIELNWDRTRHAAIALANGATLLVGGTAEGGLVRQLEAIFPGNSRSSILGLAALTTGRVDPTVLALDDGRLFVGGGSAANGAPVGDVEWLSGDGHSALEQRSLPAMPNRAFIAMPGGGVLSVPGCTADGACSSWEASWITRDQEVTTVPIPVTSRCPVPERPLLAPAGAGTPLLVARYAGGGTCSFRFDPWPGDYLGPADPLARPRFVPTLLELDPPPDPRVSPLPIGADAFLWVSEAAPGGVGGLRLGQRGALSRDLLSLLTRDDAAPSRPSRLVPDRAVTPPDLDAGEPRLFSGGTLELRPADAGVTYWVPDTRYDDMTASLALRAAAGGDDPRTAPPVVVLGETALGDASTPWPAPGDAAPPEGESATVLVTRRGDTVTLTNGGRSTRYAVAVGPVALGLRPGDVRARLTELLVERR